jgi:hypothetical protein
VTQHIQTKFPWHDLDQTLMFAVDNAYILAAREDKIERMDYNELPTEIDVCIQEEMINVFEADQPTKVEIGTNKRQMVFEGECEILDVSPSVFCKGLFLFVEGKKILNLNLSVWIKANQDRLIH